MEDVERKKEEGEKKNEKRENEKIYFPSPSLQPSPTSTVGA